MFSRGSSNPYYKKQDAEKITQDNPDITQDNPSAFEHNPRLPKITPNDNVNVNVIKEKNNDSIIPKEKKVILKKPTLEEVAAYCAERNRGVNPEKWFNHYTSNGWHVGKNKMRDWKAAVRTWEVDNFGPVNVSGRPQAENRGTETVDEFLAKCKSGVENERTI